MTDNECKIINYTITRYLAAREHSRHELLRKLTLKEHDLKLSLQQIDKFSAANIQSEARFAESLVRSRINKGFGEHYIRCQLSEHKIDKELISQAIESCITDLQVDWSELACEVLAKKYRHTPAENWQEQQKRSRFLQYRGFDHEQIRYATQKFGN
ncbi:MAG: regulatory protein [Paraglaciecola sp.]|jgi:regulatory protein